MAGNSCIRLPDKTYSSPVNNWTAAKPKRLNSPHRGYRLALIHNKLISRKRFFSLPVPDREGFFFAKRADMPLTHLLYMAIPLACAPLCYKLGDGAIIGVEPTTFALRICSTNHNYLF